MKTATPTALAAAVIVIVACSSGGGSPTQPRDPTLRVTPAVDTVMVGGAVRFYADTTRLQDSASWTVSDSRVAQIESQARLSAVVRALHQGTTTVTATQGGRTGSGVLVVLVAAQLVFTGQPSSATAGVVLTPAVTVTIEDPSGQPLTGATNAVTVALPYSRGVALLGTTTVTAVNGVATFGNLSIQQAGTAYNLVATTGGIPPGYSGLFDITPAAPTQLGFLVAPTSTRATQPITPAVGVAVQDAFANVVTSATNPVTMAIGTNPSGGTLSGTTTVNAVSGVATFANLAIDQPGLAYTLGATAPGLTRAASAPFDILVALASVSAGNSHTCGLTPAGAAYCWGDNTDGELGNGSTTGSVMPVAVSGGLTFTAVSAGRAHTCGLTRAGAAYCWGDNTDGELGNGTTTSSTTPVAVSGGLTFAGVSAGGNAQTERGVHTCGLTPAGVAYCWGDNAWGQLGTQTSQTCPNAPLPNQCSTTPVAVSGGLTFTAVSAGQDHTCGLTPAGAAYCWGYNTDGQLGNGTTTNSTTPVAVSGGLTFAAVSAGRAPTCGLTPAGAAYCWGYNNDGALGDGTTTGRTTPVAVSGGLTFAAVSAGGLHTCGVTRAGGGYCWGFNVDGELGTGATGNSTTPLAVQSVLTFVAISAGGGHTCAVASGDAAYCWGSDSYGQLGYAIVDYCPQYSPYAGAVGSPGPIDNCSGGGFLRAYRRTPVGSGDHRGGR